MFTSFVAEKVYTSNLVQDIDCHSQEIVRVKVTEDVCF